MAKEDVFQSYVDWAGDKPWSTFFTLTFGKPTTKQHAMKKMARLIRAVEQAEGHKPSWYYSVEPHQEGGYHIHGVAHNVFDLIHARWWWKKHYGRCTFRPYDDNQQGLQYITKAIFHGGEVDMAGPVWKNKQTTCK